VIRSNYYRVIEMKKRFAGMAAALLAAISFLPVSAHAVSARCAVLMDAQTGRILYEKNPDERCLIASCTKIMTALVICEQCNVLDRVRIPKEAVGIEGSSMYLKEGEVLAVQELLYGLMLHSGNDAAMALAIYCGGTAEGFAELMNDKAYRLGLENTHFANPHGLDSTENYSTARDLAKLSAYAMDNPIFRRTVSTKTVTVGNRQLKNHNKLLWQVEGAEGVKTGYTKAAGRILVSSTVRDGRRLIAVTINAPNDWQDHKSLYAAGFEEYAMQQILHENAVLGTAQVVGGEADRVALVCKQNFSYPVAKNESVRIVLPAPGFVFAPVAANQDAGYAYICIGNKAVGKVPVYYGQTVERQ